MKGRHHILPVLAILASILVTAWTTSDTQSQSKFYWDHQALLFGLQFGNSCYIQEVPRNDATALTELASLVQFENKLLTAVKEKQQLRWTHSHLKSKSTVLADMCLFAVDIYVIGDGARPRDCQEILMNGDTKSGEYHVYLNGGKIKIRVYCDMDTDGGGWLVFQRRKDGSLSFYRSWNAYRSGFGNPLGEFWLGNDNIHDLTNQKKYSLRVDMTSVLDETGYAKYRNFFIENEAAKYVLHAYEYTDGAGDSLNETNGMMFSTKDSDNDGWTTFLDSCAFRNEGAWWYNECGPANLNGIYRKVDETANAAIFWYYFRGYHPLKFTEMKIRPS